MSFPSSWSRVFFSFLPPVMSSFTYVVGAIELLSFSQWLNAFHSGERYRCGLVPFLEQCPLPSSSPEAWRKVFSGLPSCPKSFMGPWWQVIEKKCWVVRATLCMQFPGVCGLALAHTLPLWFFKHFSWKLLAHSCGPLSSSFALL